MRQGNLAVALLTLPVLAAGAAPAAEAASVERVGKYVIYRASPGETNRVYAKFDWKFRGSHMRIWEFGKGIKIRATNGCSADGNQVDCGRVDPDRVVFFLNDGDDTYLSTTSTGRNSWTVSVHGEAGNDTIQPNVTSADWVTRLDDIYDGGAGRDMVDYTKETLDGVYVSLDGQANDGAKSRTCSTCPREADQVVNVEDVTGGQKDDSLVGDRKDNALRGYRGADIVFGAAGNDLLDEGSDAVDADVAHGGDTLSGGLGSDTVSYRYRQSPVAVTVGSKNDDGAKDERDDVASSVETVEGGSAADVLIGSDGPESMLGLGGNDLINPKGGEDSVDGGSGDDTTELRDGLADRYRVSAGGDVVFRDDIDVDEV
jgi:Ca2+-binding RTX toxin-like protein